MLNKIDIDKYWYKVQKYLVNCNETPIDTYDKTTYSNLLVRNCRIVAIAKHPLTGKSLCTFDKELWVSFYTENMQGKVPEMRIERNQSWKLKINDTESVWAINLQIYSMEELETLILDNQKVAALDLMHFKIEAHRSYVSGQMLGQDFIYMSKYLEAKEILEKNIQDDAKLNYPFTTGYANVKNISLQEAAKHCLIQYEIQAGYLAESENIRVKYKDIIEKEKDIKNIKTIVNDFETEHHKYGTSL